MCNLTALYCHVDDFWNSFKLEWHKHLIEWNKPKRGPESRLSVSEIITIVVLFHRSNYRSFKNFYIGYVQKFLTKEFPNLISYTRFVAIKKSIFVPLFAYALRLQRVMTGISFVDATSIKVCSNKRIKRNRVFKGLAKTGKTTTGWFYGFKLHLIINEKGEILAFQLTPGNISDVSVLESLRKGIYGKIFGDKGYISSKVSEKLMSKGLKLFTTIRNNMKQKLMNLKDKILLRKRSIIETVKDQLKNISQIEHSRHRSVGNFLINLIAGLIAYCHQPKKPSLKLDEYDHKLLAMS